MIRDAVTRIQEYLHSHGTSYPLKRLGQKAAQQVLGTYERRRKQETATPEELRAQRENQPDELFVKFFFLSFIHHNSL